MPCSATSTQDGFALRLRLSHLMNAVDLDPPGMPPSAILLVRRLADPLPRRLIPDPQTLRPAAEWERAARVRLADFYRTAARPARGLVSGYVESVLFSDQGEMLACLASDLLNGDAFSLWWWRAILRTLPPGTLEALVTAWRRDARYVPSALSLLSERREAVRVLAALSAAQAWTIFQDVTRECELVLSTTDGVAFAKSHLRSQGPERAASEQETIASASSTATKTTRRSSPPWFPKISQYLVPESIGPERAALLGVSLLLHRAPEVARSTRFAESLSVWYRSVTRELPPSTLISDSKAISLEFQETVRRSEAKSLAAEVGADVGEARPSAPAIAGGIGTPRITITHSAFSEHAAGRVPEENKRAAEVRSVSSFRAADSFLREAPALVTSEGESSTASITARPPFTEDASLQALPHGDVTSPRTHKGEVLESRVAAMAAQSARLPDEPFLTDLGGVLFLINLLRELKLPASLETEFGLERMNGWELLELLARCLLGPRHDLLTSDSIWNVLADLAGRPADAPPGSGFKGQKRYRLPDSWISLPGLPTASVLGIRLRGSHLQIWHPSGFPLKESLLDEAPSHRRIEAEIHSIVGAGQSAPLILASWRDTAHHARHGCSSLARTLNRDLRRFLTFLMPYVRWKLAASLGLSGEGNLAESLLLRRGHLFVARSHIDLVMNLDQATVPVRVAGLDADPGWVADLGRVVKFQFVEERQS